jgi:hypothetical protein
MLTTTEGEKKKTTLCAWYQQASANKSRIQIATEANLQLEGFAKSGSSAWDCLLWSHYILTTTQQLVSTYFVGTLGT